MEDKGKLVTVDLSDKRDGAIGVVKKVELSDNVPSDMMAYKFVWDNEGAHDKCKEPWDYNLSAGDVVIVGLDDDGQLRKAR